MEKGDSFKADAGGFGLSTAARLLTSAALAFGQETVDPQRSPARAPSPAVYSVKNGIPLTIINTCKRTNMRTLTLTGLEQYPRIYAASTGEIPNPNPTGGS